MKLFNEKAESPYLSRSQWAKLFLAFSVLILALYIGAMIASLCGSHYFILNYQNEQMDKIESFLHQHTMYPLVMNIFITTEFCIMLSFVIKKIPKWYYIVTFYALPLIIHYSIGGFPRVIHSLYPFLFYILIPVIEQIKDRHNKFSWKNYLFCLLRLLIATGITFVLQVIIYSIKDGTLSFSNHYMNLSSHFIYSLEYDIALAVILFTMLLLHREKGDSKVWTNGQDHGGSSQTTKKNSSQFYSTKKNLTKTQRSKLTRFWIRFYLVQILGFLLLMVLPFVVGKVLEFLVMYLSFALVRYILGFKYSLHFKKESLCITVGAIVFGILTLAVPFFYVIIVVAILYGIGLAILLHLSYKYKGMWLFTQAAKPDKFALLYVYFDGDLDATKVKHKCKFKGLDDFQTNLITDFTQGEKISYLAYKNNYSQRMLIYKLDEAIDKLTK